MSPSPISSPRATSGSSTPLTGGSVAIPFNHLKQPVYMQEGLGSMPKPHSYSFYSNSPSYQDSTADIFRGMQPGSHMFSELASAENDVLGLQRGRLAHGEPYDGQSVLADRVSRQLLKDHVKMSPSLDLSPSSPLHTWTSDSLSMSNPSYFTEVIVVLNVQLDQFIQMELVSQQITNLPLKLVCDMMRHQLCTELSP
ncbi:hypothetical protein EZV62_005888 [Acer yangbiense]|uniref:Uncharacterized protein n=1 Tax=Acer yangbiense TaxID=1000413 RepID=A0A5C7INM4_9ROSI|nr:hypothetical protein EZV62_005888 [Acer yangbiense]